MKIKLLILYLFCFWASQAQNVTLFSQHNGRYDFTFFGNTLNTTENGFGAPCTILTSSSSSLNLNTTDVIEKAYLYWAGSGTGDFDVTLNGIDITAQRQFNLTQPSSGLPFFSAFADVTSQIQATGNGAYTLSNLDLTSVVGNYCFNATNFGGWAIIVVYRNDSLPLNQLNIYDGLQGVPSVLNITLDNLNVIDNQDAKIGFLAWEGDKNIAVNETLRINGNIISNPPLNPADNAFNGTNSEISSSTLYNMDLDVYSIQNNINIGDTSATIDLTSNQDFVMINAIVTKLNSQLPDATITINNFSQSCDNTSYNINFNVNNYNSTEILPAGVILTFYADGVSVGQFTTPNAIPIGGTENFTTIINIPATIINTFQLVLKVDDNNGVTSITELNENNNYTTLSITPWLSPNVPTDLTFTVCNEGNGLGTFDLQKYAQVVLSDFNHVVFYETLADAQNEANPLANLTNYQVASTPKTIFFRVENEHCFSIAQILLLTEPCPPIVYNHYTPNGDGVNDTFFIEGLHNIFKNFKLEIYNRWGVLIWKGNDNTPDWDGYANTGFLYSKNQLPAGTYYYVLYLNEPNYKNPLVGWVFLNK